MEKPHWSSILGNGNRISIWLILFGGYYALKFETSFSFSLSNLSELGGICPGQSHVNLLPSKRVDISYKSLLVFKAESRINRWDMMRLLFIVLDSALKNMIVLFLESALTTLIQGLWQLPVPHQELKPQDQSTKHWDIDKLPIIIVIVVMWVK